MSMNYRELGKPHASQYGEGVRKIDELAESLVIQGLLPERFPEPKIPLEATIENQAKRYLDLGFHAHKAIKMDGGKFKDSIMKLVVPQPESFKGRLDAPVAVFGQIPTADQCRLAGIEYFLKVRNARDWPEDPQQYKTPKSLYLAWTDKGARFMNRKVQDVRGELAVDERGGTEFDGVGVYIVEPGILKTRFLDLPGTAVGFGGAAFLGLWGGQPGLDDHWVDRAVPKFGSLVCGRKK